MKTEAAKDIITIRVEKTKRVELDKLAALADRDRSYLVNEAIDNYLSLQRWQLSQIEAGLRQAKAGQLVEHEVVASWVRSWGRPSELARPKARKRP